jgi:ACT domain-containing protein
MSEQQIIVTISGEDKIGIVAKVTSVLAEYKVNIEDIKQTLMQGYFMMFLLGDISNSTYSFKEIKTALIESGKELGMEVWVQRKTIFDKMHNVG